MGSLVIVTIADHSLLRPPPLSLLLMIQGNPNAIRMLRFHGSDHFLHMQLIAIVTKDGVWMY